MSKKLLQSTAVVGSMTLISRVLGFVRDMLLARFLGVDMATDAFYIAFKIPNFFRRLFAEGAFAQAIVPVLTEYQRQGGEAAVKQLVDHTAGVLGLALLALTCVGVLAAPLLVLAIAPGFQWASGQHALAVQLLQITFPYLFFVALVALAGSILNVYGRFAIPAVTPVLLNICMILAAVWWAPLFEQPVIALAWGVFIAGVLQVLLQLPVLWRIGLLPRPRLKQHAGVRQIIGLMLPVLFGSSVSQINLFLDSVFASFLPAGSVSWLYYSDRLVEFPLGIFGLALATAVLPGLAQSYVTADQQRFSQALDWGLRWVLVVGVPATIGLVLLAKPLLITMFLYGEFTLPDVAKSAQSLTAYAFGLVGFMLIRILVQGFSARQDHRTPVTLGIYALGANLLFTALLVVPLAHAGLALATSLAAFVNAGLLLYRLLQAKVYQPQSGWWPFCVRIVVANTLMGTALYFGVDSELWVLWSASERIWHLLGAVSASILLYGLGLTVVGVRWQQLVAAKLI